MQESKKKILSKAFNIVSIALLVLAAFLLVTVVVSKIQGKTPQIFGISFHLVQTDSMTPEIKIGDLVIGKKTNKQTIQVGDDILFVSPDPALGGRIIVHRVIAIREGEQGTEFRTQGIKTGADPDRFWVNEIIGKSVAVSSFWGKIFSPAGMIFIIVIIGLLVIFSFAFSAFMRIHREEKQTGQDALSEKAAALAAEDVAVLLSKEKEPKEKSTSDTEDS